MRLDILFRTCSHVEAFTGKPRFLNTSKSEIILRSLNSLLISCSQANGYLITLTIMDDHSDEETMKRMAELLNKYKNIPSNILTINGTGNGASLRYNYEFARKYCKDVVYFCEDDYIHAKTAIKEMIDTYTRIKRFAKNENLVLHPCDYPDRYTSHYPSFVFLGSDRHWRSIAHTTGTFLLPVTILTEYWDKYMNFTNIGANPNISEDNSINLVYKDVLCISPLPSLAIHFQYLHTLSPFIDYKSWWEAAKVTEGD